VVRDLIHLLAELLENATQYSPPSSRVRVSARRTVDTVTVTVFDEGIGIPATQVTELNGRLSRATMLTAELAGTMGLLVVARLAGRHQIAVELRSAAGGGTAALVALPIAVLAPVPSPFGRAEQGPVVAGEPYVVRAAQNNAGRTVTRAVGGFAPTVVDPISPATFGPVQTAPAGYSPATYGPATYGAATYGAGAAGAIQYGAYPPEVPPPNAPVRAGGGFGGSNGAGSNGGTSNGGASNGGASNGGASNGVGSNGAGGYNGGGQNGAAGYPAPTPAATAAATPEGSMGLPRRRPGHLLLPGQVAASGPAPGGDDPSRPPDPDAIRARLSGLASGMAAAARHTNRPPA
jgi:hypothetical protein